MKKITEKKEKILEEINFFAKNFVSIVLIDYSKIKSSEMKYIRKVFFDNNINVKVFKNTLVKKIFINTENDIICNYLKGQILIIFSKIDPILPVKIINNFSKEYEEIKIKSIYIYGNIFSTQNIDYIINIPDKKNSLLKFKTLIKIPLLNFNNNLKYALNKFCLLLNFVKEKIGESNE